MALCNQCGNTIIFGGIRDGHWRFCNETCRRQGFLFKLADQFPEGDMAQIAKELHDGVCPKCGGSGPVDVHTSHTIWSLGVLTSWRSTPVLCCQSCGNKAKVNDVLSSGLMGWWGIPYGLLMTPVQIFRNLSGLISPPDPLTPSPELEKFVRLHLAAQHVERNRQQPRET